MSTVIFSLSFLILLALIVYAASRRRRGQHSFLSEAEQFQLRSPRVAALFAPTARDLAKIEQQLRAFPTDLDEQIVALTQQERELAEAQSVLPYLQQFAPSG